LQPVDYIFFKNINTINWKSVVDECHQLSLTHPDYYYPSVSDDKNGWEPWDDAAKERKKVSISFLDYGYRPDNTMSWKTITKKPPLEWSMHDSIVKELPFKKGAMAVPTRQDPGNTFPWHKDEFLYQKRLVDAKDHHRIVRFITFFEDWKNGHYFQVENSVIIKWKAGDTIVFAPNKEHVGANVGLETKWTCNITGVLK